MHREQWRLEAVVQGDAAPLDEALGLKRGWLARLLGDTEDGREFNREGDRLFAYSDSQAALGPARARVTEAVLDAGLTVEIRVSRWSDELDLWLQVDPPAASWEWSAQLKSLEGMSAPTTETFTAQAGKAIDDVFERDMRQTATELGLEITVEEDSGVLANEIRLTVTGPRHRVDEFDEAWRSWVSGSIRNARWIDGPG